MLISPGSQMSSTLLSCSSGWANGQVCCYVFEGSKVKFESHGWWVAFCILLVWHAYFKVGEVWNHEWYPELCCLYVQCSNIKGWPCEKIIFVWSLNFSLASTSDMPAKLCADWIWKRPGEPKSGAFLRSVPRTSNTFPEWAKGEAKRGISAEGMQRPESVRVSWRD